MTRWLIRAGLFLIFTVVGVSIALLSACSTAFTTPPHLSEVSVSVQWSTPLEIKRFCGKDALACSIVGRKDGDWIPMRLPRPKSFSDPLVCTIGEEFLHALGARHDP